MSDTRGKLIDLLKTIPQVNHAQAAVDGLDYVFGCAADHLIANGVTFATDNHVGGKWIPANGWSQRKNCASCAHASDTHFAEACGKCVVGEYEGRRVTDPSMWKPRTKADHIRSMTDEELAKLLYEIDGLGYCKNLPECGELLDTDTGIPEEKCIGCMLNWLRQPAEEGGCDG